MTFSLGSCNSSESLLILVNLKKMIPMVKYSGYFNFLKIPIF